MPTTGAAPTLHVQVDGPADGPPLLMIMGLGLQLTAWPPELVAGLCTRGFRVIRFDNRDSGLSAGPDHLPPPRMGLAMLRYSLGLQLHSPYTLGDLAEDAVQVLNGQGVDRAHVVGISMGGMVAQHLAVRHPQRVRSLTLLMTSSGSRKLPQPGWRVQRALLSRPRGDSADDRVDHLQAVLTLIGSAPGCRDTPERLRERLRVGVLRAWRPHGTARQLLAIAADGDRTPMLHRIQAPTRVMHGRIDPLVPVAAAHQLGRHLRHAVVDVLEGMGHDLPLSMLPRIAEGIAANAARATPDA